MWKLAITKVTVISQITLSPKISATSAAKRSSDNNKGSRSGLTAGGNGLASVISFGIIMHCSIPGGGIKTYVPQIMLHHISPSKFWPLEWSCRPKFPKQYLLS